MSGGRLVRDFGISKFWQFPRGNDSFQTVRSSSSLGNDPDSWADELWAMRQMRRSWRENGWGQLGHIGRSRTVGSDEDWYKMTTYMMCGYLGQAREATESTPSTRTPRIGEKRTGKWNVSWTDEDAAKHPIKECPQKQKLIRIYRSALANHI